MNPTHRLIVVSSKACETPSTDCDPYLPISTFLQKNSEGPCQTLPGLMAISANFRYPVQRIGLCRVHLVAH